ncbi:hypothetical protein, partial [Variovorax saccharolyticus]|uniref:hypothetical protein n=1 Tax=Variovorax saccharolyticus TaxID=3053516 RepID=UPI002A45104E|nr:hypothetical protein [Variovorax sp. J31P216]
GFKDQYGDLDGHHVTVDKGNDDWAPGGRNSIAAAITGNLMDSGVLRQQAAATLMHTGDQGEVRQLGYAIFVAEEGVYREVTDEEWARLVATAPQRISLTQALSQQSTALDLGLCVAMKQRDVALREWRDLVETHLDQSQRVKGELQVDGWLRGILQSQHLSAADKQALLSVALREACWTGRHVVRDTCLEALAALTPDDRRKILNHVPAHAAALRRMLVTRALRANEPGASALFEELKGTVTEDELQRAVTVILQSQNDPPVSFLCSALERGHARTIDTVGQMMNLLSPEDLREFLTASGGPNAPAGLFRALEKGQAAAIGAYGKLLQQGKLSPELSREILGAKTPSGIPGLAFAMQNGHHEAIAAYGRLLSPDILRDALMTYEAGPLGLLLVLQRGHHAVIPVYGELLEQAGLRPEDLAEILMAKAVDGATGLYQALRVGHPEAIAAYGKLLQLAKLNPEVLHEIVKAKVADGRTGLHDALENGNTKSIAAYATILLEANLSRKDLRAILLAKTPGGFTGLSRALIEGHPAAMAPLVPLLHALDDQGKVDVLECMVRDKKSGLVLCMKGPLGASRKAATMQAYFSMAYDAEIEDLDQRRRLATIIKKSMAWFSFWSITYSKSGDYKRLKKSHPGFEMDYLNCIKHLERPEVA